MSLPTSCVCHGTGVVPAAPWNAKAAAQRPGYQRPAKPCPEVPR